MNYILKASALSLVTAITLGMSGCSDDSTTASDEDLAVSGKAVDGYLVYATVCLDLDNDGYCQLGVEPATSTDINGSFSLSVTAEQRANPGYATAPLLVYGGYDADTNADFVGKLKATFDEAAEINVTPISTMVEAMVAAGEDVASAEVAVGTMLGLPEGTDLGADPVAAAQTDPQLLRAALQLQKSLEILAQALAANSTTSEDDLVDGLYASLATQLRTATDLNLTEALGGVVGAHDDLDAADLEGATAISGQIELIIGEDGTTDTAVIGTQIGAMQDEIVVTVIDGDGSVGDINFDDISGKEFSLLHAEEILRIVDFEGTDAEFNALALKVQTALKDAGMGETEFLPIQTEITALKGHSDAEVRDIGARFEARVSGFETEAEDLDTFANAEDIQFEVPMTIYNFDEGMEGEPAYSSHAILSGGVFEEKRFALNPATGDFEEVANEDVVLDASGNWVSDSITSYTLANNDTELIVGATTVKLIQEIDLVNPSVTQAGIIQEIAGETGITVSFASGSKAYVLTFKDDENYRLDGMPVRDWTSSDESATFSTLQNFFDAYSVNSNTFTGNEDSGLSFNAVGGETIALGTTGTLSEYTYGNENTPSTLISDNAGTWEVKNVPGTTDLAIFITPSDPDFLEWADEEFFMVYSGTVHRGTHNFASNEFDISDTLEFNQAAFDSIMNVMENPMGDPGDSTITVDPTFIPITSTMLAAGQTFYDSYVEDGETVYGKIVVDSTTQLTRVEMDAAGTIAFEESFEYTIINGGIQVDLGTDYLYFQLNSVDMTAMYVTEYQDEDKDGDYDSEEDITWFYSKPTGFPTDL